MPASVSHK